MESHWKSRELCRGKVAAEEVGSTAEVIHGAGEKQPGRKAGQTRNSDHISLHFSELTHLFRISLPDSCSLDIFTCLSWKEMVWRSQDLELE